MPGIRITDLTNLGASLVDSDILVVVDWSADETKRITVADLVTSIGDSAENATNALTAVTALTALNVTNSTFSLNASFADSAGIAASATEAESVNVTVNPADVSMFPALFGNNTNTYQTPAVDSDLSYNASTGTLSANFFVGDGSNLTNLPLGGGGGGSSAVLETKNAANDNASYFVTFVGAQNTVDSVNTDTEFTYNPSTGELGALASSATAVASSAITSGDHFLTLKAAASGAETLRTDVDVKWNATTEILTATNFSGNGSRLTSVGADSANIANTVAATAVTNNASYYPTLSSGATGAQDINTNSVLRYNPNSAGQRLSLGADGAIFSLGAADDFELEHDGTRNVIRTKGFDLFIMDAADSAAARFDISTGNLDVEGDIIAFSANITSDPRLKDDITSIENALDKVVSLEGVSWNWKRNGKKSSGVLSTHVKQVMPELVSEHKALNGSSSYERVNYDGIIGYLVESIKELKNEIEDLKIELNR